MSDRISDVLAASQRINITPNTADQLAAARQYVYRNCPPQWLADVLDAIGITEGTNE